jgi:hypothetical protein
MGADTLSNWGEVNRGLDELARSTGWGSRTGPWAWADAALEELAARGLPVPTEAEALAWADAREAGL